VPPQHATHQHASIDLGPLQVSLVLFAGTLVKRM